MSRQLWFQVLPGSELSVFREQRDKIALELADIVGHGSGVLVCCRPRQDA